MSNGSQRLTEVGRRFVFVRSLLALLLARTLLFIQPAWADQELRPGDQFEVVGSLYAYGVATDLRTRAPVHLAIVPLHLSGPEIVSAHPIPMGSRITIVAKVPRRWPAFLFPERYVVQSDALKAPPGLVLKIDLNQGNEGAQTPLNPAIYRRVEAR